MLLRMLWINTPSAIQLSKNLSSYLHSVARFVFTPCSPHTVNYHAPATPPKRLSSLSSPIGKLCSFWKVRAKMLLVDCMLHTVALNYSLSRHTEDVRQIYNNNNNNICGSPGQKSNIISSRISSTSPSSTCYGAKLPHGAELIRATQTHQIFMHLHSTYEPHPQRKFSATARQTQ